MVSLRWLDQQEDRGARALPGGPGRASLSGREGAMDPGLKDLLRQEILPLRANRPEVPKGAILLDANECALPPTPAERQAIERAIARVALERYPDARAEGLRGRLGEALATDPEGLLLGNGLD